MMQSLRQVLRVWLDEGVPGRVATVQRSRRLDSDDMRTGGAVQL